MAINLYEINQVVRCEASFRNAAQELQDPPAVSFMFRTPAGNDISYTYPGDAEIVRDATGKFHVDISIGGRGDTHYRWQSEPPVHAVATGLFVRKPSMVGVQAVGGGDVEDVTTSDTTLITCDSTSGTCDRA